MNQNYDDHAGGQHPPVQRLVGFSRAGGLAFGDFQRRQFQEVSGPGHVGTVYQDFVGNIEGRPPKSWTAAQRP